MNYASYVAFKNKRQQRSQFEKPLYSEMPDTFSPLLSREVCFEQSGTLLCSKKMSHFIWELVVMIFGTGQTASTGPRGRVKGALSVRCSVALMF